MTISEHIDAIGQSLQTIADNQTGWTPEMLRTQLLLISVRAQASAADSLADIAKYLRKMSEYGLPR